MDPRVLKAEFGSELTFMGGVDVKQVLTKGTKQEIRGEIRRRIEEMGVGGGYILAPSHNFGNDIPLENMLLFFEAGQELGVYPL
jgi:uroporphyrinogen decarboxylase